MSFFQYNKFGKVYDSLNKDCDYEKWSQYLINILKLHNIETGCGLDFACGSGKLTAKFCDADFKMIGVDFSEEMLNAACRQNSTKIRNKELVFAKGDMTTFKVDKELDFVCSTCDGVNYIDKKAFVKFCSNTYQMLKSGGVFMFDVSSKYKLKNILGNNIFADDTDKITYIWQNDYDEKQNKLEMTLIFFERYENAKYERFDEYHTLYSYESDDVVKVLHNEGFKNIQAVNCFTMERPNEKSERIQFIAVKP